MNKTSDLLNKKLAEIQRNKQTVKSRIDTLVKHRAQAERDYIALDGAEQVLLQLIQEHTIEESEAVENATDND